MILPLKLPVILCSCCDFISYNGNCGLEPPGMMIWGLRIVAILTITCGACAFEHHMLDENNILLIFLHNFESKGQISLDFLLLKVSWLVSNGVGPDPVEGANKLCQGPVSYQQFV